MERRHGRKNQYDSIDPLGPVPEAVRPSPPSELEPIEREIWVSTVATMERGLFSPEVIPQLRAYVAAAGLCRRLEERLRLFTSKPDCTDIKNFDTAARLLIALATALRLTPRSRKQSRDVRDQARGLPMPWEDSDAGTGRRVQPYEL